MMLFLLQCSDSRRMSLTIHLIKIAWLSFCHTKKPQRKVWQCANTDSPHSFQAICYLAPTSPATCSPFPVQLSFIKLPLGFQARSCCAQEELPANLHKAFWAKLSFSTCLQNFSMPQDKTGLHSFYFSSTCSCFYFVLLQNWKKHCTHTAVV